MLGSSKRAVVIKLANLVIQFNDKCPERLKMLRLNRGTGGPESRRSGATLRNGWSPLEPLPSRDASLNNYTNTKTLREAKEALASLVCGRKEKQAYGTEQQSQPQRRTVGTGIWRQGFRASLWSIPRRRFHRLT